MTVITNIVVALMIVTQSEEPVKAIPLRDPIPIIAPEIMLTHAVEQQYIKNLPSGDPETLYRKVCKTNFVYSTTIPIRALRCQCEEFGCGGMHNCTFDELLGRRIRSISIEHDSQAYCEKHKKLLK